MERVKKSKLTFFSESQIEEGAIVQRPRTEQVGRDHQFSRADGGIYKGVSKKVSKKLFLLTENG